MNDITRGLMDGVLKVGTSDLHMSVGSQPWYRQGVRLVPIAQYPIVTDEIFDAVIQDLTGGMPDGFDGDWDTAAVYGGRRLRLSLYKQMGQRALAIRVITEELVSLSELGVPAVMERIVDNETMGLILICGATGSGKSTTLAAALDHINASRSSMIITIEDPVEYVHTSKMSFINQREVGSDTKSFAGAIRAAMRQDPNVIMVGEMRDFQTMDAAITAAETGHLVMTTVHAMDAASAINRIVGVFPANQQPQIRMQLAGTLKLVMVQKLLPRKADPDKKTLVAEVLVVNPAVAVSIRENSLKDLRTALDTQREQYGSQSLAYALGKAVDDNEIEEAEARLILTGEELKIFDQDRQRAGAFRR